ncbi:MAG: hypothetical protein KAS32_08445 [Candidatus Peribacteraceae bacterium]|nr:hypothetical protein [Candidatus Peribacteraceae bacterium]
MQCVCIDHSCISQVAKSPDIAMLGRNRIVSFLPIECEKTTSQMAIGFHAIDGFMILELSKESEGYRGTPMLNINNDDVTQPIQDMLKLSLFKLFNDI